MKKINKLKYIAEHYRNDEYDTEMYSALIYKNETYLIQEINAMVYIYNYDGNNKLAAGFSKRNAIQKLKTKLNKSS